MITFIAHLRVKPDRAADFEALMTDISAKVRQHEPDVLYYEFARSAAEPNLYVVVEVYRDREANAAHMALPWIAESLPLAAAMMESPPDIRQYVSRGMEPIPGRGGAP